MPVFARLVGVFEHYFLGNEWSRSCARGSLSLPSLQSRERRLHLCAEYFVATSGNNSAAGTSEAPWQTLQYAASRVAPGDRVIVRPGNYVGFHLTRSGTAAAPIEFFAEPGVLVNQRNATTPDGINLENASHVVIDGFAVTGMPRAGVRSVGLPTDFAAYVTIRNVHSYNNGTGASSPATSTTC